jgi:hypothetical protein
MLENLHRIVHPTHLAISGLDSFEVVDRRLAAP